MDRTLILVKPDAFARGLSGEIIARVRYNTPEKTYSYEDREFMTLDAAKVFARACLIRAGKIEEADEE